MLGWAAKKVNRNALASEAAIEASRTPPWLASGWGCRGRRLSRGRGNLYMRSGSFPCRPEPDRRVPVRAGQAVPGANPMSLLDDRELFGIGLPPVLHRLREDMRDLERTLVA